MKISTFYTVHVLGSIKSPLSFTLIADNSLALNRTCLLLPPLSGLTLGVIPLVGWGRYGKHYDNATYCEFDFQDDGTKSYFLFIMASMFLLPVLLTLCAFTCILTDLYRTTRTTRHIYGANSTINMASTKTLNGQSISCVLTGS